MDNTIKFPSINQNRDAYSYLEEAWNAKTKTEAVRLAKEAIKLDPNLLEAHLIVAASKRDLSSVQKELEKILKMGEKQLKDEGISFEDDIGSFYLLFETRPYIRIYSQYLDVLISQSKIKKAISVAKEIIRLNENDNMGVRYRLMSLYAVLEDKDGAEDLLNTFVEDTSVHMLLPIIALYYKLDETKKAKEYLNILCANTPNAKETFQHIQRDEVDLDSFLYSDSYMPNSQDEIFTVYADSQYLYLTIPEFIKWIVRNCPR